MLGAALQLTVIVVGVIPGSLPVAGSDEVDFDRELAPLFAEHCLGCHNASDHKGGLDLSSQSTAFAGGESGVVLQAGDLEGSLLWHRVIEGEMPPEETLPDDAKARIRRWIEGGATWGTDPIDPLKYTTAKRAGYDWWSLQPIERSAIPAPRLLEAAGVLARTPIDRFILAKLDQEGLTPSPEADGIALIRRLTFDLTGLPPTPEDVDAFVSDPSEDAYERLVDRLLASPAYGERWARHWLDVVRFGESQGFERDKLRDGSWRYRDWVAGAFNEDLPYDTFTRWQLAGDVIDGAGSGGVIATGFLVAGPWDEVGQQQQSDAMKRVVRQDELEDYVSTVGQTFLGLTVNCARCHDHKFDPVRQTEYYRLAAALDGVKHGERPVEGLPIDAAAVRAELAAVERRIQLLEQPIRERLLAAREEQVASIEPPRPIARWTFDDGAADDAGDLDAELHGASGVKEGRLRVDGKTGYVTTGPLDRDITEKTLEVWLKIDTLAQRGGGAISLQTLDGATFDAIVFGEREPLKWMAGSDNFARYQSFGGPDETAADQEFVHVAIAWHGDGTIAAYRNGVPYGAPYHSGGPATFKAGEAQVLFGLRHTPPGGNRFLSASYEQAHLYDRALTPEEVAASAGLRSDFISEEQIVAELSSEERTHRDEWRFEAENLRTQLARAEAQTVYAVTPELQPGTMHVMLRGNPATPGEAVTPGGVAAVLPERADFGLDDGAGDAARRRALAEWMTHRDNPLLARVIVNRLWQYHFGAGFVATPSDFGFSGGMPTHPDLLDWLAAELAENGYSLKHLQRLIVTSAVYRQSSKPRPDAMAVDAGNRWLWRMSPRRLEAECVRDAILAVSGVLNTEIGGPGYHDFTTFTRNTQFYELLDPIGPSFNRRSLYRCWVRSGRSPFLDVFDCPDPSTKTPSRAVTTTPLQSLSLMNNSFVLRMADRLAERLTADCPGDGAAQVNRAFQLLYSRPATADEQEQARVFIAAHGLPAFSRVLFNTNEFLYVE